MKERNMRAFMAMVLLASMCSAPVLAETNSDATDLFRQLIQKWEDAIQARDVETVGQIEADDWRSIGSNGKVWTREMDLDGIKSMTAKHVRAEIGPIDVKMVSEDVAVTQGTLTDKNTGSAYAYMDVWMKRGGKWQVVRSLSTKLK
jgi:ketosteroid isomerase-like protein